MLAPIVHAVSSDVNGSQYRLFAHVQLEGDHGGCAAFALCPRGYATVELGFTIVAVGCAIASTNWRPNGRAHHGAVDLFGVHTGRDVASGACIETDHIQFNRTTTSRSAITVMVSQRWSRVHRLHDVYGVGPLTH